ncbi:MAG: aspartate/glutamate racemase family protein [Proteobacteria bacterium]|nr:aspartate/glutamate racemase family protein [Pseudomonadota bacterium]
MSRLLLINPNTTRSITDLVLRHAARFASRGTTLRGATAAFGPKVVASRAGYAIAAHAALDALANDTGRRDAVVLACFGDPGLAALKDTSRVPVVGLAEASIRRAVALGQRFSIVTGGVRWKPMLEEFVASQGLGARLASVRTVAPTGVDIARQPQAALAMLARGCAACVKDGADVVILGGAGLAGLAEQLADTVEVPLLDSVQCAIARAETLARAKRGRRTGAAFPSVGSAGLSPALARLLR